MPRIKKLRFYGFAGWRLTISASTMVKPWPWGVEADGVEADFGDLVRVIGGETRQGGNLLGQAAVTRRGG